MKTKYFSITINNTVKIFLIMLCVLFIITSGTGCTSNFNIMPQDEKREYVRQELNSLYGIDCEISEIRKKQISMFENEEYYTGTASLSKNRWFPFWIDNFGNINDTYFCIKLSDNINEYFSLTVDKYYQRNDYYLYCNTAFIDPPGREWNISDNIEDMFREENIENNIFLFLGRKSSDDMQRLESIQNDLQGHKGRMKVYYCENPGKIDFDNYDLSKHEYFFELK